MTEVYRSGAIFRSTAEPLKLKFAGVRGAKFNPDTGDYEPIKEEPSQPRKTRRRFRRAITLRGSERIK